MKAVLLSQTIAKHGVVGIDIAHMVEILARKYEVSVYCDRLMNRGLKQIGRNELLHIARDEKNLLIYHHNNYWEAGDKILDSARARVIVKYHNITPAFFFEPYSDKHYLSCKRAREQTIEILEKHPEFFWMGDSAYDLGDVDIYGHPNTAVVPPFNHAEQWRATVPNEVVLRFLLETTTLHLLFVGPVAPNKGHKALIEILRGYGSRYGYDIALHMIGKRDEALQPYNQELDEFVSEYALAPHIKWVSEIDDSTLLSYYLGCDLYITCSDHEGFCVPIIEAQSLRLPVIAKGSGAVPETMGEDQLLLEARTGEYVDEIRKIEKDPTYKRYLVDKGLQNYQKRFTNKRIEERFVKAVQDHTGVIL